MQATLSHYRILEQIIHLGSQLAQGLVATRSGS